MLAGPRGCSRGLALRGEATRTTPLSARGNSTPRKSCGLAEWAEPLGLLSAGLPYEALPPSMRIAVTPTSQHAGAAYPTWVQANVHTQVIHLVRAQMETVVQPQLDNLAERVAMLLAAEQAHGDVGRHESERAVLRLEGSLEKWLNSVESKLSFLTEDATRSEHRDQSLNFRVAALSECLGIDGRPRLFEELERHVQRLDGRLEELGEGCRSSSRLTKKLEQRLGDCRSSVVRLEEEFVQGCTFKSARSSDANLGPCLDRIKALEERVHTIGLQSQALHSQALQSQAAAIAAVPQPSAEELFALVDDRLDVHRGELRAVAEQASVACDALREELTERCHHLEERCTDDTRTSQEQRQSLGARLAEFNARLGALQVKANGLEGRLQSTAELLARGRPLEADLREQVSEQCNKVAFQVEGRMDAMERQMEAIQEECGDLVEQSLERRLAALGGAPVPEAPPRSLRAVGGRPRGEASHARA